MDFEILPTKYDPIKKRVVVDYNGPSKLLSPTGLDTVDLCEAKWAWGALADIQSPPNKYAQIGIDAHQELEDYYNTQGQKLPNTHILMPLALPHFPIPGPGITGETVFGFLLRHEGKEYAFHGIIDVLDLYDPNDPGIYDLKTTGSFDWAKTPTFLEQKDLQANIYALYACLLTGASSVRGRWVYCLRGTKTDAKPVDFTITYAGAVSRLLEILPLADRINELTQLKRLNKAPHPTDLNQNEEACSAFGGCFYYERCKPKPTNLFRSLFAQEKAHEQAKKANKEESVTSAADKIAALRAAKTTKPATTTTPAPNTPPTSAKETLLKRVAATSGPAEAAKVAQPNKIAVQNPKIAAALAKAKGAPSLNPPEADDEPDSAQDSQNNPESTQDPDPTPTTTPEPETQSEQNQESPKRRGRPAGSKNKPKETDNASQDDLAGALERERKSHEILKAHFALLEQQLAEARTQAAPATDQFVLYVDVSTDKGTLTQGVDAIVAEAQAALEQELDLPHYRLAEYNKGPGLLAFGVAQLIADKTGHFSVRSDAVDREVLQELYKRADVVIRGR